MVRHFSFCIGLLIILTSYLWTNCSAAALSMEDKFRELELRLGTTEARSVQVEEKMSQLEAQLELNVSLINLHQFGIDYILKKS
jgi:hypothetical protein